MPDALARPAVPALAVPAVATQPTVADTPAWDRRSWEVAVLSTGLHGHPKLIGLLLARRADERGHLPIGGSHTTTSLAREASLTRKWVRMALLQLELAGLLRRPPSATWQDERTRPIDLIVPRAAAARAEPPHTGERP